MPHPDEAEEIVWQGRFVTAKRRGKWEYVSRARNIRAAVILAIDADDHVLLVEQFRVPLGRNCIELPAGLVGEIVLPPIGDDPARQFARSPYVAGFARAGIEFTLASVHVLWGKNAAERLPEFIS